jgi:hypothetical protein
VSDQGVASNDTGIVGQDVVDQDVGVPPDGGDAAVADMGVPDSGGGDAAFGPVTVQFIQNEQPVPNQLVVFQRSPT